MTTEDKAEKERILDLLVATDAGTHLMHEGFDVNNPQNYTREWFSWANMMFCELVMDYFDIRVAKNRRKHMKKKVYIISYSHWDREWYMAYEQHHMRLVELMDDLLELFEEIQNSTVSILMGRRLF